VMLLGIIGTSLWAEEKLTALAPGQAMEIAGYRAEFSRINNVSGPNYTSKVGQFQIYRGHDWLATANAEKRHYTVADTDTSEVGLVNFWHGDLYIVLGKVDSQQAGLYSVHIYYHPMVLLLWLGPSLMVLGGALAWWPARRKRIIP